jgi:predicted ferric reductase
MHLSGRIADNIPPPPAQGYWLRGLVFLVLLWPLASWLFSLGNPVAYLKSNMPPGQVIYQVSKLFGLYAIVLLWAQVMCGLIMGDQFRLRMFSWLTVMIHRRLGIATLLVSSAHFLFFLAAASVRKHGVAYQLLLPDIKGGFYSMIISLGWFALVGMYIVAIAGWMRMKGASRWKWPHRISLAVFVLAVTHSQLIGSEAQLGTWGCIYLLFGGSLFIMLARRFRHA